MEQPYSESLLQLPQVTFVQEGKGTSQEVRGTYHVDEGGTVVVSGGRGLHREVAIILSQLPGLEVISAEQLDRSVVVLIEWQRMLFSFVCSHLPYNSQGLPALVEALQELQPIMETHRSRGAHIVWGLDANVCLGAVFKMNDDDNDNDEHFGLHEPEALGKSQLERAETLLSFLMENNLSVATFGNSSPTATWFPWGRGPTDPGRQIDFICSSLPMTASWTWDIMASKPSDHVPLYSHVVLPATRSQKQQQRQQRYQHCLSNRVPLDWHPKDLSAFHGDVAAASLTRDIPLEQLVELVQSLASKHAMPRPSSKLSMVREEEKANMRQFLAASNPVERRSALRALQKHRRQVQASRRRDALTRLLALHGGGFASTQRRAQAVLSVPLPRHGPALGLDIPADVHMRFWRDIHAIPDHLRAEQEWFPALSMAVMRQLRNRVIPLQLLEVMDDAFEPGNMYQTVRQMKSAASPGHGLPVMVLRALPRAALSTIADLFKRIFWQDTPPPSSWQQPLVRLVGKTVRAAAPAEFRPISVTDSLHRLYSK